MYDKHDYSLFNSLTEIFSNKSVGDMLSSIAKSEPFTIVDIGCGFSLRYTGHILYALAQNNITNTLVHVVDPALYGHGTHISIGEIKRAFPSADFIVHPEKWDPTSFQLSRAKFQLAIAIQTTSLLNEEESKNLHIDLQKHLITGGLFIDISEVNDTVTDQNKYPYLNLHKRSAEQRINIAFSQGFKLACQTEMPAHAVESQDDHVMVGMAFSKQ